MIVPAEVNIKNQDGFDMTLDCSSRGIPALKVHLQQNGFFISNERIEIPGTPNISDLIELSIEGDDFLSLRESLIQFLNSRNVNYTEEQFNDTVEQCSRFNLEDISAFDRAS